MNLFESKPAQTLTCRDCKHRERHQCNSKVFQYCGVRKSNRTDNGKLKIKCKTAACYLFENYIKPSVALWTIYHSYMSIQYRATNKGIVKKVSDTSESIEMSELERVLKPIRDEAEFVTGEIFKYISNNPTAFPEYFTVNGVNRTTPKTNVYTSGIVYKDRRAYGSVYCINFRV